MILKLIFIAITLLYLHVFYLATSRNKSVYLFSAIWIGFVGLLSYFNFFLKIDTTPPRFIIVLFGAIFLVIFFYHTLKNTVLNYFNTMLLHAMRIAIEIALYYLYVQKLVPKLMTFNGCNFDIFIGIFALMFCVAFLIYNKKPSKKMLLIWNIAGLVFLLNIVALAILSAPFPFQQFSFEQPNTAVLQFPYILLPAYIVPIVFLTHILNIKQIIRK